MPIGDPGLSCQIRMTKGDGFVRRFVLIWVVFLGLLPAQGQAGPLYTWKDTDGQLHISDNLPQCPENARELQTRVYSGGRETAVQRQERLLREYEQERQLALANWQRREELQQKKLARAIEEDNDRRHALHEARLEQDIAYEKSLIERWDDRRRPVYSLPGRRTRYQDAMRQSCSDGNVSHSPRLMARPHPQPVLPRPVSQRTVVRRLP
ncbi:MAG: DUF4124 domain-containing protein [Desulfuromonas thiophila]|nr:DUF4124 domain-containing protein [Desulfuromonas thiophila]